MDPVSPDKASLLSNPFMMFKSFFLANVLTLTLRSKSKTILLRSSALRG